MLDSFLKVAYVADQRAQHRQKLASVLAQLPDNVLMDLAAGKEKLAYHDDGEWLEKFKGTPLFQQAFALEQKDLELKMQDDERRRERRAIMDQLDAGDTYEERDALCLQRKVLDLELAKVQEGIDDSAEPPAGAALEAPPEVPGAAVPEAPPMGGDKEASFRLAMAKLKLAAADPEGHMLRRALLGNPISSAMEAQQGQKGRAFSEALGHAQKEVLLNSALGGGLGAGVGGIGTALGAAAAAPSGKRLLGAAKKAPLGALVGLGGGAFIGSGIGTMRGHLGREASEIHGRYSKERAKEAALPAALLSRAKSIKDVAKPAASALKPGTELSLKSLANVPRGASPGKTLEFKSLAKSAAKKQAFLGPAMAMAKGLAAKAPGALRAAGVTARGAGRQVGKALQTGGAMPALRTAGQQGLQFIQKHPGVAAAGLGGAGLMTGAALS